MGTQMVQGRAQKISESLEPPPPTFQVYVWNGRPKSIHLQIY